MRIAVLGGATVDESHGHASFRYDSCQSSRNRPPAAFPPRRDAVIRRMSISAAVVECCQANYQLLPGHRRKQGLPVT